MKFKKHSIVIIYKKKNIEKYENIIIEKIGNIKELKSFQIYLRNHIFKLINNGYNFERIINEIFKIDTI